MSDNATATGEELQIRSRDQTGLFVRRIRPTGALRARLLWVHGFAEHGGRYTETLRWFAERGFESWMLDLRGHGRSDGRRTFINRFSEYLDDMEAFYRHVGQQHQDDVPVFGIGHSMGGLVVGRTLQDRLDRLPTLKGAVILSPFLGVKVALPAWKTTAGRIMSRILPWFALPSDISNDVLSKDPEVGRAYDADPLVSHAATARWYTETMAAHPIATAEAGRIKLPVLVMHGLDDGLADVEGTKTFFGGLGSDDKELKLWDNLRHELLNEVEKEQVREHILGWLEARLK
jgi:alpha-beta hydrolase superfamily lysophospholipase